MKSVEIGQATRALCDYTREAHGETLVVTRRGRPVAAVVPLRGVDMESLALATNPDFVGLIERARARYKATGGVSLEEMRRRWGAASKPPRTKAAARTSSRRASVATQPARRSVSR
jgi:antitoxin (DNA-binding transcriptional repressor) of toxin-antitoxin stability system